MSYFVCRSAWAVLISAVLLLACSEDYSPPGAERAAVAVGGTWPEDPEPSQYPQDLRIDWVRVWQLP